MICRCSLFSPFFCFSFFSFFLQMASPTALSAGAVQHAARVARLYRHALKNIQSWAVDRELFWEEVKRKSFIAAVALSSIANSFFSTTFFSLSLHKITSSGREASKAV